MTLLLEKNEDERIFYADPEAVSYLHSNLFLFSF